MRYTTILWLITSICCFTAQADPLPALGTASHTVMNRQQENRYGKRIMMRLKQQLPLFNDSLTIQYVRTLGDRLTQDLSHSALKFHFFIIKSPQINAFALPGGYIGINTGLILAAQDEDELAGVLAHEIAHVTQRHIVETLAEMHRMQLPSIAATLASVALLAINPAMGSSAMAATTAGLQQHAIQFTRRNEEEADRLGMARLTASGFDPHGMPRFFARLHQHTRYAHDVGFDFLRTHPISSKRIADTIGRIKKHATHKKQQTNDFALIKARVAALVADDPRLSTQQQHGSSLVSTYRHALLLTRIEHWQKAKKLANSLIQKDTDNFYFKLLAIKTLAHTQAYASALKQSKQLLKQYPNNSAVIILHAQLLLRAQLPGQARELLSRFYHTHPEQTNSLELLAQAAAKSGQVYQAHMARAAQFAAQGDFERAIHQIQIAQQQTQLSNYERARLKAQRSVYEKQFEAFKQPLSL